MKSVYLFYPSKITGGAEFLLKTVADFLKNKVKVTIVDIDGGWLSLNVQNVELINLKNEPKINLTENDILITTANLVRKLDLYFSGNFKIISWIVHVNNATPSLPKVGPFQHKLFFRSFLKVTFLKSEYKKLNALAIYLEKNNAIYTMDDECNDVFYSYFKWKFKKHLPVVLPVEKIPEFSNLDAGHIGELNCIWIGRLDGQFKNPILHHVLLDLSAYSKISGEKIVFNIVGNGPGLMDAKKIASNINNIEINFLGEVRGDELIRIIKRHDIGFAMGTSALEMAACGVATVLLDMSYGAVPKSYKYQWLYESKGYRIGRSLDGAKNKTLGNTKTIKDVFNDFHLNKNSIRVLCYEHVRKYHSIQVLEDKILQALDGVSSNFQEMQDRGLMSKPYWYIFKRN